MTRLTVLLLASTLCPAAVLAQTSVPVRDLPPALAAPRVAGAPHHEDSASPPSLASLLVELPRDFARLRSQEAALIVGMAGGAGLALRNQDARFTRLAAGSGRLDTVFEPGEVIGGGVIQTGAAFAAFTAGRLSKNPRLAALGADLVRAQFVNAALTHGIKLSVGRRRPDGSRFSFPSGHTSAAFANAAVLHRHFGWKAGAAAYGLAAYIAGSRLQENKHYLSDVLFGAAIGIISGRAVTAGHGKAAFAVGAFAAPGGGGIGVSWLRER